jgi:hypothetical protein
MRCACACVVLLVLTGTAAAQRVYELEATANVGVAQTTQEAFIADPNADSGDNPASSTVRAYTEVRPAVAMQGGNARSLWRLGYQFAGTLALDSSGSATYNNQLEASLNTQATKFTLFSLSGSIAQGSQTYLLTSRPAESGIPDVRAPSNPGIVAASLAESVYVELGPRMRLSHGLVGTASALQEDLTKYSASATGTLGIERTYPRDNVGMEVRSSISYLQPQNQLLPQYVSTTNGLVARWSRDFSTRLNGFALVGAEQVYTDSGSKPLAFGPTATVAANYTGKNYAAALEGTHGIVTNIQVGTISTTDRVSARGMYTIDALRGRAVSGSVGFLHNTPVGEADAIVAAGTGYAAQLDAAYITKLDDNYALTARYSFAYQFDQAGGLGNALAHIVLVGITARYSNVDILKVRRPRPARGRRVDNGDGLFPVVDEVPLEQ